MRVYVAQTFIFPGAPKAFCWFSNEPFTTTPPAPERLKVIGKYLSGSFFLKSFVIYKIENLGARGRSLKGLKCMLHAGALGLVPATQSPQSRVKSVPVPIQVEDVSIFVNYVGNTLLWACVRLLWALILWECVLIWLWKALGWRKQSTGSQCCRALHGAGAGEVMCLDFLFPSYDCQEKEPETKHRLSKKKSPPKLGFSRAERSGEVTCCAFWSRRHS